MASVEAAEAELRAAGFLDLRVSAGSFREEWTPDGYLAYIERCRNALTFARLDGHVRRELLSRVRRALEALPRAAFMQRAELIYALGRRPR